MGLVGGGIWVEFVSGSLAVEALWILSAVAIVPSLSMKECICRAKMQEHATHWNCMKWMEMEKDKEGLSGKWQAHVSAG